MSKEFLFSKFWDQYVANNPHVKQIYDLFVEKEGAIINDHIALRTFNDPRVNVDRLAEVFKQYGYVEKGTYEFKVKKLFAKHFEHEDPTAPKVFISELLTEEFSPELQNVVKASVDAIPQNILDSDELVLSGVSWQPLSYKVYQELLAESEYAAWMYAFGFCANHFTVNINELVNFHEVAEVNEFIKSNGFELNSAGGEIKGSPEECLEQSSTLAGKIKVKFSEGEYEIPSCYYEFARRHHLASGELYTGFVAASADKIFESTDVKK